MSESIGNGRFFSSSLVAPPRVVHVLAVDGDAEQLRVARLEFLLELAEGGDLGRAHEGEVLRPEEHDLPLARVKLSWVKGWNALCQVVRDDAGQRDTREISVQCPACRTPCEVSAWRIDAAFSGQSRISSNRLIL